MTIRLTPLDGENTFWSWSVSHYAQPEIERALLRLQDDFGFDVNATLWCCWCAEMYAPLSAAQLAQALSACDAFTAKAIKPLREARRYLKTAPGAPNALYRAVKAAELDGERYVQDMLYERSHLLLALTSHEEIARFTARARANLNVYAHILGANAHAQWPQCESLLDHLSAFIFGNDPDGTDSREPAQGNQQ